MIAKNLLLFLIFFFLCFWGYLKIQFHHSVHSNPNQTEPKKFSWTKQRTIRVRSTCCWWYCRYGRHRYRHRCRCCWPLSSFFISTSSFASPFFHHHHHHHWWPSIQPFIHSIHSVNIDWHILWWKKDQRTIELTDTITVRADHHILNEKISFFPMNNINTETNTTH